MNRTLRTFLKRQVRPSALIIFSIAVFLLIYGAYYAAKSSSVEVLALSTIACIALIVQMIAFYLMKSKGFPQSNLWAFTIALFMWGGIFMLIFTPFSVPDEVYHFIAAYQLSDILLLNGPGDGQSLPMRSEDLELLDNLPYTLSVSRDAYPVVIDGLLDSEVQSDMVNYAYSSIPSSLAENPIQDRLAPAIGITISRILGLNATLTFYAGRICSLVLFVTIIHFAVKHIPLGKPAMMSASLLPMALHLAGSYSYDSFTIAITFLFIALIMEMIIGKQEITGKQVVVATVVAALLAPCKVVYSPCVFLVLFAKKELFKSKRDSLIAKSTIIGAALVSLMAFKAVDLLPMVINPIEGSAVDIRGNEAGEFYDLAYAIQNPASTMMVYLRTMISKIEHMTRATVGGELGWFQENISASTYIIVAIYSVLMLSCFSEQKKNFMLSTKLRTACAVIAAICWIAVMTSMFIGWTFITENEIQGIQGRYIVPILPLILIAISPQRIRCGYNLGFWCPFLMCSVNAMYIIHIASNSML